MRTRLAAVLLILAGCGGSSPSPELPATAAPDAPPPPPASDAPDAGASAEGAPGEARTPAPGGDGPSTEASVGQASAKGVRVENGRGEVLDLAELAFTAFARKSGGVGAADVEGANVSFASVSADGATATDVACHLPAWNVPGNEPLTAATMIITFAAKDAIPAASILGARAELAACAPGKPLRLSWSFRDHRLEKASAPGADAACLMRALAKRPAFETGRCAATLAP